MTLRTIFRKLRKVNYRQYRQFFGCVTFANMLVASFLAVLFSSFIQSTLPEGGDSRKQIYLIFGVAVVGCFIFVLYAAGLFFRYKSKEVGAFLALGTEKRKIRKALVGEVAYIAGSAALVGIIIGNLLALIIGKVFERVAITTTENAFSLSLTGFFYPIIFSIIVFVCLFVMAFLFMKRSNIIDIINEQRRSEPIKKEVSGKYLLSGILLFVLGIFLAVLLPKIYVTLFRQYLSGLFNLFYLLCVIGMYRILVYSIVVHKRGRNPQKYYKNLISYGMLKFQGISMVRNMGLIALLLIGALYAAFYLPSNIVVGNNVLENNPVDASYRFPGSAEKITEEEVLALAKKYDVQVQNYRELEFIELLSSGINRDDVDEDGKIIEIYEKEAFYRQFVSVENLNAIMGTNISVERGTYKMIRSEDMVESVLFAFDDLDYAKNTETGVEKNLTFAGTQIFNELVVDNGWDTFSRIIINDEDYAMLREGIASERESTQVLFNVADLEKSYEFSKALFKEYCLRAEEDMKVLLFYDSYLEQKAEASGEEYVEAERIELQPDSPEVDLDWKFAPYFKALFQKNILLQMAVQYLLFAYVATVMLASVGIIAYTRSQNIALSNKQVYEDVRKLGADNAYILKCVKDQLKKVYLMPTIIGVGIIYLYQILIFFQNDGYFSKAEGRAALVDFGLCLFVVLYQYIGYRISLKSLFKIFSLW